MKPESWSVTRQKMIERCGMQYYHRYVRGMRIAPDLGLVRGRTIHAAAEQAHRRRFAEDVVTTPSEMRDIAASVFDRELSHSEWTPGDHYGGAEAADVAGVKRAAGRARDDATDGAARYQQSIGQYLRAASVLDEQDHGVPAVEVTIPSVLPGTDGVELIAVIDLIDSEQVVRDLKSVTRKPNAGTEHGDIQLATYALVGAHALGIAPPLRAAFDVVVTPRGELTLTTEPTLEQQASVLERMARGVEVVTKEVFLPTDPGNWACSRKFCGYFSICPYGARGRSRPTS